MVNTCFPVAPSFASTLPTLRFAELSGSNQLGLVPRDQQLMAHEPNISLGLHFDG